MHSFSGSLDTFGKQRNKAGNPRRELQRSRETAGGIFLEFDQAGCSVSSSNREDQLWRHVWNHPGLTVCSGCAGEKDGGWQTGRTPAVGQECRSLEMCVLLEKEHLLLSEGHLSSRSEVQQPLSMASTTAQSMGSLPSGLGICTTLPDIFYLPELIFGGLVWILVASTHVSPPNPLGWVMFVSIFCFVLTFLWLVLFACGAHQNSGGWAAADFAYHGLAAFFFLSASVVLAYITIQNKLAAPFKTYQIDIAAVVLSHVATLLYFIHAILSAIRWKNF
ncbi:myelin and lymphocyte protein-like [Arapaima gigas]